MFLLSVMLAALVFIVVISTTSVAEEGLLLERVDGGSGFGPFNSTGPKEDPYEANWVITDQPRCCSDCTFVAAGFKCKVKSCLHNCPWARSAAPERAIPVF